MSNSFNARSDLKVGDKTYEIFRLDALQGAARLPFATKILLENLLRNEDGITVTKADIEKLAAWDPQAEPVDDRDAHLVALVAAVLHRGHRHLHGDLRLQHLEIDEGAIVPELADRGHTVHGEQLLDHGRSPTAARAW